ncbi:MAG: DnaA regulatory inactivator Hda [Gammaproteobacteria bacterium]|nr:DnaA regulatory inactivator Hda [Gammaproteobacteria bacterium]
MSASARFEQIALGLSLPGTATFADFWQGPNRELVAQLERLMRDDGGASVYLSGPPGSGKTHLLQACCNAAQGRIGYLPLAEVEPFGPRVIDGLDALDCVCIDDLDRVAGREEWEHGMFVCCNRLRDAGRKLIVSGAQPLRELPVRRDDVLSRLAWGLVYRLRQPDDAEFGEALRFLCERRGMPITPQVIEFLLRRLPRSLADLVAIVEQLDAASLQAHRRLSVPFVKDVLRL